MGGAKRAQVISRLQTAQPSKPVGFVKLLTRNTSHIDVERLRLINPFLAARRTLDQPLRIDLECGRIKITNLIRNAVNPCQRTIKIFEIGNHYFVPQIKLLQISN